MQKIICELRFITQPLVVTVNRGGRMSSLSVASSSSGVFVCLVRALDSLLLLPALFADLARHLY